PLRQFVTLCLTDPFPPLQTAARRAQGRTKKDGLLPSLNLGRFGPQLCSVLNCDRYTQLTLVFPLLSILALTAPISMSAQDSWRRLRGWAGAGISRVTILRLSRRGRGAR